MPSIPLEGIGGERNQAASAPQLDPYVETLVQVLESPRGLAIEYKDKAAATTARWRFYAALKKERGKGNHTLDGIVAKIEGNVLKLIPPPEIIKVREL